MIWYLLGIVWIEASWVRKTIYLCEVSRDERRWKVVGMR